jgi:hypothetical protein
VRPREGYDLYPSVVEKWTVIYGIWKLCNVPLEAQISAPYKNVEAFMFSTSVVFRSPLNHHFWVMNSFYLAHNHAYTYYYEVLYHRLS